MYKWFPIIAITIIISLMFIISMFKNSRPKTLPSYDGPVGGQMDGEGYRQPTTLEIDF